MFHSARHVTCRRVGQYFCLLTIFAVCLNISQYRSGPGQAAWLGWVCSVWPGAARARGSVNFANMAWPHHRVESSNFGIKATTITSLLTSRLHQHWFVIYYGFSDILYVIHPIVVPLSKGRFNNYVIQWWHPLV